MKVVINRCEGGFSLSDKAMSECQKRGLIPDGNKGRTFSRDDFHLVQVVERLGEKADGDCAWLFVVEIPDDMQWDIEELNGMEWLIDKRWRWHRNDWSEGRRSNQIFASDFLENGGENEK